MCGHRGRSEVRRDRQGGHAEEGSFLPAHKLVPSATLLHAKPLQRASELHPQSCQRPQGWRDQKDAGGEGRSTSSGHYILTTQGARKGQDHRVLGCSETETRCNADKTTRSLPKDTKHLLWTEEGRSLPLAPGVVS